MLQLVVKSQVSRICWKIGLDVKSSGLNVIKFLLVIKVSRYFSKKNGILADFWNWNGFTRLGACLDKVGVKITMFGFNGSLFSRWWRFQVSQVEARFISPKSKNENRNSVFMWPPRQPKT